MQATGKKKAALNRKKQSKEAEDDEVPVAHGLVLVGDVGFENFKTASKYLKARKLLNEGRLNETSVGFGNLSAIAGIIEQQQQDATGKS